MKRQAPTSKNKVLRHFRFSEKMISLLSREAERTHRTRTKILEIAFARMMALKAEERDRESVL